MAANGAAAADDIRNPYIACLRETKDGMFGGGSKLFYLWVDLAGVTFLGHPDKRVLYSVPLDAVVSAVADGLSVKLRMPEGGKKSKPVDRKFTSTSKRAEMLVRRINELKDFWEEDPDTAAEHAEAAFVLEEGTAPPDRLFTGVDPMPGGGAFVEQWQLKGQPNPHKAIRGSMSDGSLAVRAKSNGHVVANGFGSDSQSSGSGGSPVPLARSAGSYGNGLNHLPSNGSSGGLERNGSGVRYEMSRLQRLQVERQGMVHAKADAMSSARGLGAKINYDAFHCKYVDVTNPQYQPRVGVMLLIDRDGVHIVKDGGGQMHSVWRRSVHFKFEQIARTKPMPADDEWRLFVKKQGGGNSVFCYRFETSLPELIDEVVRPYLGQYDPHVPESSKTPPPLFDDKADRERRERIMGQVDDEIRHSGRLRHLTHMLGVSQKLVKNTRNEEELSAEVLDFMEALNSFLLEGKMSK